MVAVSESFEMARIRLEHVWQMCATSERDIGSLFWEAR